LLDKGAKAIRVRLESLNYELTDIATVDHTESAISEALTGIADLTLILGASATSDRADVAPAAVVHAGGKIERFGMPVDPGNLLFLGSIGKSDVVGLPGCARSPALNGVDWVLERLSAQLPVTSADIANMGVGGLLKEMTGRPHPRRGAKG
jgi:molybdenum cofactor cytidylyltransferase